MNILYVSQYFPPEMGAPAARAVELSRHWARMGHEVTVLTGFPNHPTGVVPEDWRSRLHRLHYLSTLRQKQVTAQFVFAFRGARTSQGGKDQSRGSADDIARPRR